MKQIFFIILIFFSIKNFGQESGIKILDASSDTDRVFYKIRWTKDLSTVEKNKKLGLYNRNRKEFILPNIYDEVKLVNKKDTVCSVELNDMHFLVNKKNKKVSNEYDKISTTYYHNIHIAQKNNKSILINSKGSIISDTYDKIFNSFYKSQPYSKVKIGNNFGIIDSIGAIRIPLEYSYIKEITNNEVIARKNGKMGVLDIYNNKKIIPFEYTDVSFNSSEYYVVEKNFKKGLVDKKNKLVIEFIYSQIYPPRKEDGYRLVENGRKGLLDTNLNLTVPVIYYDLEFFIREKVKKRIIASKRMENGKRKWGIIDFNNNIKVPFEYDKIYRGDYNELIKSIKRGSIDKSKIKNWDIENNIFIYSVIKGEEKFLINEKGQIVYKN